jgi:hypothetical protein
MGSSPRWPRSCLSKDSERHSNLQTGLANKKSLTEKPTGDVVGAGRLSLEAGLQQVVDDTALRWDRTVDLSLSEVPLLFLVSIHLSTCPQAGSLRPVPKPVLLAFRKDE